MTAPAARGRLGPRLVFQYNPETIRRHVTGPEQSMAFTLEFDARDPEEVSGITSHASVAAALDRLAQLMAQSDRVDFQWGDRTTPVVVRELSIVEECFDGELNPGRAVVDVVLEVVSL
jgi:hypothetical protein